MKSHPAPHRDRVALSALLFGLAAAPLAWQVQILVGSAAAPSAHKSTLLALFALCLAAALTGGLVALRSWRLTFQELPGSAHDLVDGGEGRTRFMAMCGMLVSLLFFYALLFGLTALCLVPPPGI
jgi:hypothetical protein